MKSLVFSYLTCHRQHNILHYIYFDIDKDNKDPKIKADNKWNRGTGVRIKLSLFRYEVSFFNLSRELFHSLDRAT